MKARATVHYLFLFLVVAAVSCKNNPKSGKDTSLMDQVDDKEEAVEAVIGYPIPTSYQVVKLLNDAGAPFNIGIINPISNASKYVSTKEKAINLGIYGADLSYASTYNYTQSTREYLNVSRQLIDDLQIASPFNEDFAEKVEENIDNKDTVISLITESFYDTYNYLRKNDQDVSSVLVVAGSWIEGVYITSQIYFTSKEKEPFVDILVHQKSSLDELLELFEPIQKDENISDLRKELIKIKKTYDEFSNPATAEQIMNLSTQIEELRNSLI